MRPNPSLSGDVVQFERPDWRPLSSTLGERLAEWFMWMHEVRLADGTAVHAYKHVRTRRYLHLDCSGAAFAYLGGSDYAPVSLSRAVMSVVPRHEWALLSSQQLAELMAAPQQRA